MQIFINAALKWVKWPIALLMILMFLPALQTDIILLEHTLTKHFTINFILPMFGSIGIWFLIPGLHGSHLAIFEHEFTHMLAALLTFHRPKSMSIDPGKGGSFGYYGEGNWFITLAPYFVPTFPLLLVLFSLICIWLHYPLPHLFMPTLGVLFGYHLVSNAAQIHPGQTDFSKAGWLFTLTFLPTANLLTVGFIWAFAFNNLTGVTRWGKLLIQQTQLFINQIF